MIDPYMNEDENGRILQEAIDGTLNNYTLKIGKAGLLIYNRYTR